MRGYSSLGMQMLLEASTCVFLTKPVRFVLKNIQFFRRIDFSEKNELSCGSKIFLRSIYTINRINFWRAKNR
jgi:hypothetical protein